MTTFNKMDHSCTPEWVRNSFFKEKEFDKKLNLACGADYLSGWVNLDGDINVTADIHHDLDDPDLLLPFPNQEFDLIYASHILEHITYIKSLKKELMRILKPGGTLIVIVPYYLSPDAWGDDTHVRAFSIHSFLPNYWPHLGEMKIKIIDGKDPYDYDIQWLVADIKRGN